MATGGTIRLAAALILIVVLGVAAASVAEARQWRVAPRGNMTSIGLAVRQARAGDTIVVERGLYREAVSIDKPLTLIGRNRPVIDGESRRQPISVRGERVTITGFTIRNSGRSSMMDVAAIKLDSARRCTISDCELEGNYFGIYLANSVGCVIRRNRIRSEGISESSTGNGIHLWHCSRTVVADNRVSGHRDGIYFEFVTSGTIYGNHSEGNLRYGLHFMFSDSCAYSRNIFRENGAGVAVMYTRNVTMEANRFEENWGPAAYGLLLKDISHGRITNNTFDHNTVGIYCEGGGNLDLRGNNFSDNGWAIRLMASSFDNRIVRNTFAGNTFDVTTNSWSTTCAFDSNYWDRYSGYDVDRNGVGDVPFRPVRLFSYVSERSSAALILLNSFLLSILEAAEETFPSVVPENVIDSHPMMRRPQ